MAFAMPPWPRHAPLRVLLVDTVPSAQLIEAAVDDAEAVAAVLSDLVFFDFVLDLVAAALVAEVLLAAGPVQVATPPWLRQAPLFVFEDVVVPSLHVPVAAACAESVPETGKAMNRPSASPTIEVERRRRMKKLQETGNTVYGMAPRLGTCVPVEIRN